MSWTTITSDDVLSEFTPIETAALQNIQGVTDNLDVIVTRVLKKIRSMIKGGGNQLDQTGNTIPDGLVEEAIAMARWKWITSFPALKFLASDARKTANDDAMERLQNIASQDPARERTELPVTADATPSPLPSPSFGKRPIEFTRKNQDG